MDAADSSHRRSTPLESAESSSALRMRLAELDAEMDALDARLRLLAAERRRVIHSLDSITYPVLTLPPEITAHIFSCYVDNPHIGYPKTPGRGPIVLASVCREWRNICLSVGSLWASLCIYPTPDFVRDIEDFLSFIRCWLSRAGRQPLDLQRYSRPYLTLRLTLDLPFSFPIADILGRIPSLTKLAVTIMNEGDEPVMLTAFSNAPALHDVQLSGASLQWISLPWIQLTHLEFSDQALSACVDRVAQPSSAPLILPNLRTLEFSFDREGMLLTYLTLPVLQNLELTALVTASSSLLRQLGQRSAWSLRSICLTGMRSEAAVICLQSLPSLEAVEIRNNE
ncbi:hypothetical protein FB451DRAFT_1398252 [Mycena latifolia]|nr:hypothetical protein FB451DRAFT_1398252 [Mycena latifolia]